MTDIELVAIRTFVSFGMVYYILSIVDIIRRWNGEPK